MKAGVRDKERGYVLLVVSVALLMIATASLSLFAEDESTLAALRAKHESAQLAAGLEAALTHNLQTLYDNTGCSSYVGQSGVLGSVSYSATLSAASSSPIDLTVTAVHTNGQQRSDTRSVQMYSGLNVLSFDAVADAHISEDDSTENFGDRNDIRSYAPPEAEDRAGLLRFDISSMPKSVHIDSAELQVYLNNNHGIVDEPDQVLRVTRDWVEDQVTWERAKDGLFGNWTDGGEFEQRPFASFVDSVVGFHTLDLTSLVRLWHTGLVNEGLLIKPALTNTANDKHYRTTDSSQSAQHPRLIIDYRCDCLLGCV